MRQLEDLARVNGAYSPLQQQAMANLLMGSRPQVPNAYDEYLKEFDAAPDVASKIAIGKKYGALLNAR